MFNLKSKNMKKINLLIALTFIFFGVNAQSYSPVTNEYFAFSTGEKEVFKTSFDQVNASEVEEALKDYLKNYKAKLTPVKGVDKEFTVEELNISDINQNVTTMAVKITELEGNATMYIHYLTNEKIVSVTNTPSEFEGYVKFTEALANKATFSAYNSLIDAQNTLLNDRQKELKGFEKDEENKHDDIGKAKKSIKDSQVAITKLEGDLKNQQALVTTKKQQVSDKEAEIAGVNVKTLETDIKDIEKENKSLVKDIEKLRGEIAEINGEIAIEEASLETQRKGIEAQKNLLSVTADKKTLKEVQSMEKEEAKMIGAIEEKKGEIANAEASIATHQKTIETNNGKIASIQAKISAHSEDALKDQLKVLEKELKSLESDEKNIVKDIEKENNNITKQEENIRQSEADIVALKESQAAKTAEISKAKDGLTLLTNAQAKFK